MAQTIKHRRGKLESVKDITPINGELIIASGSDLSVHQEGLLFVGVEGNVLTPSNKIMTGSADMDLTGSSFDHSIDGIPYYETDEQKLYILGKGGRLNTTFTTNSLDLKGSGLVSSSTQVSELAGIENSTLTITAGDGLKTGGTFTTNQSSDTAVTLNIDVSDFAGTGIEADGSENLRLASQGTGISGGGGSTLSITAAQTGITSVLNAALVIGRDADNDIDFATDNTIILRAGGEDQLTLTDGALTPSSNAIVDLGTDALEFKDAYFDGTVEADAITIGGTAIGSIYSPVAGHSSIATVGTIGTGTWQGTAIDKTYLDDEVYNTSLNSFTASNANTSLNSATGSYLTAAGISDTAIVQGADSLVFFDATDSGVKREAIGDFLTAIAGANLSVSSNQLVGVAGDITGVTAGDGLSGGGSSGAVTLTVEVDDSTIETNSDALRLKDGGTTLAKQADMAADRIQGRANGGGTGVPQALTAAQVRTIINVEDGATADQTGAEIATALNADLGGNFTIGNQSSDTATFSGGVTVAGDLTVNGTTTYISSSNLNIGDNILELNYAGTAADAGILVKDAVSTGTSGSLLWDASEDYWIAGALGSEARVILGNGTDTAGTITKFSADGVITDSIITESGTTVTISNNLILSGLTASQLVATNGSKQLVSTTDISSLTLTLDGGEF